jgi:hypothetical protein
MQTPLTHHATPPSHEKLGENARRRLFDGRRAAMSPRQLTFGETDDEVSGFATSTPASNNTIDIGSSPWENINAELPPLRGPTAEEVSDASTPGWRDRLLASLHRLNTPVSLDSRSPDPSPLPPQVRHVLRGTLERPVKVVVTKFTTYEIIPL